MATRHGGQILIEQLRIQGCDTVFCLPGESYLAALDGLADRNDIRTVVARQEGGAAIMAEAHAKMTGRPGVAFVTRGPGATNASAGVHIAMQDSTPMLLCIGQVQSDALEREAFQEVDYRAMFGPLAKWVGQVDRTDRIPEYLSHAWHTALSGRPGPVVLAFPEDILSASADVADCEPANPGHPKANPADIDAMLGHLAAAERPLLIVGGGGWSAQAASDLSAFARASGLPVIASLRCQDYMDNRLDAYVGDLGVGVNPALVARVREADVVAVLGARMGEITTSGYSILDIPNPRQTLLHVHAGADELGRVYRPDLAVNATAESVVAALSQRPPLDGTRWAEWTRAARAEYDQWMVPEDTPSAVRLEQVVRHVSDALPDDAVITNGAGNYTAYVHRYYRYRNYRTQLAPTSGSMGYGLPAAIAAKIARPESTVVCFAGDGCFQMTGQEFGTAVQAGLALIVIVANNGMYGTIRMHQERRYPGRVSATDIVNPDFAALARSYGAFGETVVRTEDFPAAFERARASGKTALIELRVDPEALSPRLTLSGARAIGEQQTAGN